MRDGSTDPGIGIVVVAYEAEAFIERLLDRIPTTIAGHRPHVLVSDDHSGDRTGALAKEWSDRHPEVDLELVLQPANLGYGGNQKFGYEWARRRDLDVAVLIHGDAQYPPELAGDLVRPLLAGEADAVFGSRMIEPGAARRGGMPPVRFLGNRVLSRSLNRLAGARFSEWFSGFRAYRTSALAAVDHLTLPDGFDFDTAITLRLLARGLHVVEVPIPTRYGDEVSRVPLLRTGVAGVAHGVRHRRRGAEPGSPPSRRA